MRLLIIIVFLTSQFLYSQSVEKNSVRIKSEIEEDPLRFYEWFHEMRKDHKGEYSEGKRWETFLEMKQNTLSKTTNSPAANWINLGPNTLDSLAGRVISHAFDPTDNDIIWAGSGSGGLWRSTNAGASWEPASDQLPSLEISSVAIDPSNRDVMLIGTGIDKVTTVTLKPGIGVLKSTDRGLTWNLTSFSYNISQAIGVSKILWHPDGGSVVYLAASNGLWKSEDAGDTWFLKRAGRPSSFVIDRSSPEKLYAIFRGEGVFKSTDNGNTWLQLSNGIATGSNIGFSSITICDSSPNVLYASLSDATNFGMIGFYKTTDGGSTWNVLESAPKVVCQPNAPTSCIGWFVNMCAVSPTNPDLVFLGGVQLWRSSNGGQTWTWHDYLSNGSGYNNDGLAYVDQWDFGFDPQDENIMYVFNDGGVQKSYNGGTWWYRQSKNLVTAQIYRITSSLTDTTLLLGGFQDHGLQKLENVNGNLEWKRWSINDGTQVIVDPTNSNIFYGSFFFGAHYKNASRGNNWLNTTIPIQNGIQESGPLFSPLVIDHENTSTLYTASSSKIYKTTNGGAFWNVSANIPNVFTMTVDKQNSNIVYAHSYTGSSWSVHRSNDAGANWKTINHSSIPSWRVVDLEADPNQEGVIYAVRNSAFPNSDHIKKSTDYGETWVDITNNLPDITMNAIAISYQNSDHLYVATDLGVFVSTNGGQEWTEFNDGLPLTYASDIHYHPVDRTVRISTIGRGVWKTKAVDVAELTEVDENDNLILDEFSVYNNYPNPFNPSTNINFEISKTGRTIVKIYNELGQEINEILNNDLSSGVHSVKWNGANKYGKPVSSGVYYARIIFNGFAKSIKMNLVK